MSILATSRVNSRLQRDHAAWTLLRAQNADVIAAVLKQHLGGNQRRLPAPVLFEKVDVDLQDLRADGYDLPRTAQQYCTDWRNAGFLIRRASHEAREEIYELSPGALSALAFLDQLAAPRRTVTESRLATIQDRLRQLARDTDPDTSNRIASLVTERDRIQTQIDRLEAGEMDTLGDEKAAERLYDVISLAEEIPVDFSRVRDQLEQLNKNLREELIDLEGSRSSVLDNIFRGVDLLQDSDAGRSFNSFYSILVDPELDTEFQDALATVLNRDFIRGVETEEVITLRQLMNTMQERGLEIHTVLTSFGRSLRRFVQTQELQQNQRLNSELQQALKSASSLADTTSPIRRMDTELSLTQMTMRSVSALRLHNPGDYRAEIDVVSHDAADVDFEELLEQAREIDIDMDELLHNVNAVVDDYGAVSISEILVHRPATQGFASVVGLLIYALEFAEPLEGHETVDWDDSHGSVDRYLFTERINL